MTSTNANKGKRSVYVIGTDEAGYGPNLGPLLVGASCWRLNVDVGDALEAPRTPLDRDGLESSQPTQTEPVKTRRRRSKKRFDVVNGATLFDLDPSVDADLPQTIRKRDVESLWEPAPETASESFEDKTEAVSATGAAVRRLNDSLTELSKRQGLFPLIDSKKLYGPSKSLAALERSFWLAVLLANGVDVESRRAIFTNATFRTALELVAHETFNDGAPPEPPWEKNVDFPLPADEKTGAFDRFESALTSIVATFAANEIQLLDVAARRVQPFEFNALIDSLELKSELIAEITTSLAAETLERVVARDDFVENAPPIFVVLCDKLGGRDRYEPLLSARFPDAKIKTILESRSASVYRLAARRGVVRGGKETTFSTELLVEIRFTAKGESNVPTALASIAAKYFRELSMKPFNDFWRRAANGFELKPTAGYPLDAKRFRVEVAETQKRLEIDEQTFWRRK